VLLLPLLALTAAGPAIARAREDGSLELWLSQPIGRFAYLAGVTLVRYGALVVPLLAVLLVAAAWASLTQAEAVPWRLLGEAAAVNASLLWAFVALGIWTSVLVRGLSKTTTYLLLFWALGIALLDFALIGLMLQWRLPARTVFVLAALNPVQAARLAILSGVEPDLAMLGPVGFYLANRIGSRALFALGVGWPALFGTGIWLFALRAFRRRDAV
jgi:ABC-type transport system involved in multi-copper enzyme maturation permease subunit